MAFSEARTNHAWSDSIAVTGLSCRLAGECDSLESFWRSICAGESAWSEVPPERFNINAFWSPNKRHSTSAARGAHFMREDLSKFDAGFFGLPKHDADAIDPQQRLMMEVTYEALERAGLRLDQIAGTRTGVFMGTTTTDYRDMICRDLDAAPQYTFTGNCPASLANRISWLWDLRGPSFPINTACSSSLIALHLACQSLQSGESDIAIVGASSCLLNPEMFIFLSNHGFLSPDGKCKSFDASANGYGRGEGFGCLILKRAEDAIAAHDPIRAVIRGTGSNQDGRTKGLTMPSGDAQKALIEEVYRNAGLDLGATTYVEAHGTGTKLGDLEEMRALAATLGVSHDSNNKLIVGSVKSNIGHLEAAAGVVGVIKAVLMLETGLIPPNVHFKTPNPEIQWDNWNVRVPTELSHWPTDGVRRVSVNSFGYGGSNAHVVLDDAQSYLRARRYAANKNLPISLHAANGDTHVNGFPHIDGHSKTNGIVQANGSHHINGHPQTNGHAEKEDLPHTNGHTETNGIHSNDRIEKEETLLANGHSEMNGFHSNSTLDLRSTSVAKSANKTDILLARNERAFKHTLQSHEINGANDKTVAKRTTVKHSTSRLFVWSAQDKDGLRRIEEKLARYIRRSTSESNPHSSQAISKTEDFMARLAYTLGDRRSRLQWKAFAIASSPAELITSMTSGDHDSRSTIVRSSKSPRIGFVFTGQGAQWARMGIELMAYEEFRESIEAADRHLQQCCGCPWSVAEELLKESSTSLINNALYSHCLSSTLQIALVDLLRSWNILPTSVVGHSGGEIAACYAAGGLKRSDAWEVAYYRGVVSSSMKTKSPHLDGAMMAVGLSHTASADWIAKVTKGKLVVACVNSPTSTTIAGDSVGVDQLFALLKEAGVFARKLMVDTAYHSHHMEVLADDYRALMTGIETMSPPTGHPTMFSTVTGGIIDPSECGVDHFVASITAPVQFSQAVQAMVSNGNEEGNAVDLLLELGPHSVLQGPSIQSLKAHGVTNVPYYSVLSRNLNAVDTAMNLAGVLFAQSCPVSLGQVNADDTLLMPLVDLPTYTWNHTQSFWHNSRVDKKFLERTAPKPGLIGAPTASSTEAGRTWKGFLRLSEAPWISDHKIQGSILYPGAGYIVMAIEAATQTADQTRRIASFNLRDIQLTAAGVISEDADLECVLELQPFVAGKRDSTSVWTRFTVSTSPDGNTLVQNCCGLIKIEYEPADGSAASFERDLEHRALETRYHETELACSKHLDPNAFYAEMRSWGLDYGPVFTNVCEARNGNGECVGAVKLPEVPIPGITGRPCLVHPATLDAVLHLAFAAAKGGKHKPRNAMVPKFIETVTISANVPYQAGTILPGFAKSDRHGLNELHADIIMLDELHRSPTIVVEGLHCAEIAGASTSNVKSLTSRLTWKPAIDILTQDEMTSHLSRLPTGETQLLEYLELMYHTNPSLSVLEVAADMDSRLFQNTEFAKLLQTWDLDTAVADKTLVYSSEQSASFRHVDFRDEQMANESGEQYDLLIASAAILRLYTDDLTNIIDRLCKVVKQGGSLCFYASESILSSIEAVLQEKSMERTVLYSTDAEPGHIVSRKSVAGSASSVSIRPTHKLNGASPMPEVVLLLPAEPTQLATTVASQLVTRLEEHEYCASILLGTPDASILQGQRCISLLEFQESFLYDLDSTKFEWLKKLLLNTASLFWITALDDPRTALIDGLVRVVRNETPGLNIRIFHADEPASLIAPADILADSVCRAFHSAGKDDEFKLEDGILHVCRAYEDTSLNQEINSLLPGAAATTTATKTPLGGIEYPVKLCVPSPGMLNSVCLEWDETAESDLEPDHVEIETKASALNFREVMVAMGQMDDTALGLEAAGVIRRVGSSVTKFKAGDSVMMSGYGAHRTFHRAPASFCALIPDGMSFELAASIPVVHATAWNALVRVAKVQRGQSILIHAAAGGVGQVACQIARYYDMEVFASVSSETKKALIMEQYGIQEDHIFYSRDTSFAKGVKRMTNGRGVDVVLNSLAGEALQQSWNCIAPFGHFVEIGIKDILNNTGLDMRPFLQDATFSFFNLRHVEQSRPDLMAVILEGAFDFLHRGITRPVEPLVSYPISQVEDALRLMQTGKHIGKIALTWGKEDAVSFIPRGVRSTKLSPDGVYLLVGGMGGLGRSLASKLVSLGARKLCFLSRSGAASASSQELVQRLRRQKVQVQIYSCDVGDEIAVANAIQSCTKELGTIRGAFQCAMVLRDGLFVNMTHQDWVDATRPKVQGSWNLHTHLPTDLDFYITLSSFTGVFGSRGQSNYAAAGAYEDKLAYHRRSLGQHATTIDLGLMRDIGVLAELGMTEQFRAWELPYGIREEEFYGLIDRVIGRDIAATFPPQVVTGLATGGSARLAGIDTPFYLDDPRFSIMAATGLR